MTDIVWNLRNDVPCNGDIGCAWELCHQAADEIERLRAALRPFADALNGNWSMQPGSMKIVVGPWASDLRIELTLAHFRNARAALEGK